MSSEDFRGRLNENQITSELILSGIELVIFDWSGVISDDRPPVYEANMRLLEKYGKPRMTFDEWLPRTTMTPIEFLANHGVHGDPDDLFEEYRQAYELVQEEGIVPIVYEDTKEVLDELTNRGKRIAVVSSHPEENLRNEAEEYGLTDYFDSFFGNIRDKAQGLLKACEEAGIDPDKVVYIGDTIYDIQGAKKAGVSSIGMATGYHIKDRLANEEPDLVLESLSGLLDSIE